MKELTESGSGVTLDGTRVFLIVAVLVAFAWFVLREVRTEPAAVTDEASPTE